jgi:hypothetical protein
MPTNVAPTEERDELSPQYSCFVEGCPGKHTSKWQICPDRAGHDPDLDEDGRCRICGEYEPE